MTESGHRTELKEGRRSNFHPLEAWCHDCDWRATGPSGLVYLAMDRHEKETQPSAAPDPDGKGSN